jgi:CheY-like chemotaxis protein
MTLDVQDKLLLRLAEAEKAAMRARDLTQQLLAFSKGGAPVKKITSVKELLSEWVVFALRGSNVKCEFRIPDDLWDAEIDEGQVSQVFHNLAINADQAMPEGGRIYVSGENRVETGGSGSHLVAGNYVKISIRDEGIGVAPEHLQRIFEPYFTTKAAGSGLGLATSYTTIKRHGGHIAVTSEVGVGTIFHVFLPASESRAAPKPLFSNAPKVGQGKILLMDDESIIRDLGTEMLTRLGYQVATTKDGLEAITLYRKSQDLGDPFDAVIMDLTIPGGMGGKEAIKELLDLDPGIKAVVSSGYCNDPIMGEFKKHGFAGVLAKPYSAKEMSEVLHTIIQN